MSKLIDEIWEHYAGSTKSVNTIRKILKLKDNKPFNDHITYWTINTKNNGIESLSKAFYEIGYEAIGNYTFPNKKLNAIHLSNKLRKHLPSIFISELNLEEFSPFLTEVLVDSFKQIALLPPKNQLTTGRTWEISKSIYEKLELESEFAAWLYVNGLKANHFSINVNELNNYTIEKICTELINAGIALNLSGGKILKGSKASGLIQASIMADKMFVNFSDSIVDEMVPSSYIEFTERHNINGKLFNGFNPQSATKIFDSCSNLPVY